MQLLSVCFLSTQFSDSAHCDVSFLMHRLDPLPFYLKDDRKRKHHIHAKIWKTAVYSRPFFEGHDAVGHAQRGVPGRGGLWDLILVFETARSAHLRTFDLVPRDLRRPAVVWSPGTFWSPARRRTSCSARRIARLLCGSRTQILQRRSTPLSRVSALNKDTGATCAESEPHFRPLALELRAKLGLQGSWNKVVEKRLQRDYTCGSKAVPELRFASCANTRWWK